MKKGYILHCKQHVPVFIEPVNIANSDQYQRIEKIMAYAPICNPDKEGYSMYFFTGLDSMKNVPFCQCGRSTCIINTAMQKASNILSGENRHGILSFQFNPKETVNQ